MSTPPPVPPTSAHADAPAHVPNHLAWAIISMIASFCLCCFVGGIPGIVAIVYAAQVNGKLDQGDIAGARRASDSAKTWCWVATALAIAGVLLTVWSLMTGATEQYLEMFQQMQAAQG
ncbi:CD225/dispanin family protein [Lysobacter sp. D1-1-M9]|uniref:CD225/dispanin family protein n=1 Tax=Novilysobacter longmucuonensis TaxID=3098603 RepID=UPI002FC93EB3